MNPKRSFGSISNPASRPIDSPFFVFVLDRRAAAANSTSPNQTFSASPPGRFQTCILQATGLQSFSPSFASEFVDFTFFSVYKTWRKRFRVDTYVLTFRSFEPWLRDSRWSNLCFLILYTGHNAFYILFWYIWYYYFLHIYWYFILFIEIAAPFGYSHLFWLSMPLFYFQFVCFIFALMATIYWYVCALSMYIYTYT